MLPEKSGVYLFRDNKNIIYVGKARNIKKRVASYFSNKLLDSKTILLLGNIKKIDYIITSSEIEAFLLEEKLIKKYLPIYNIRFTDGKTYPYIKIAKDEVAYITVTRKKTDKNAIYFGPYTDAAAMKTVLKLLRRIFPYQSVKNHIKGKCFYYHLNLCPCVSFFNSEISNYKKSIKQIIKFLQGKKANVIKQLETDRSKYVKQEEFEKAKNDQEKINKINLITSESYEPFRYELDHNLHYKRIQMELDTLIRILRPYFPEIKQLKRVECFDISNIGGKQATGSMVVAINGDIEKSMYRRFRIKLKNTPDDYSMMREMLSRRLKRDDWQRPDLIIVDGGRGQVSSVINVYTDKKIPLIGLAKREEMIIVPKIDGKVISFKSLKIPISSPAINLLRRVRDEAHRFALSYHRLLRKKNFLTYN